MSSLSPTSSRSKSPVASPRVEHVSEAAPSISALPTATGCSLFVGKLAYDCRTRELEELFGKYGRITRCDIKKGFAFIEFEDERDATDAIKYLDGTRFLGFNLTVERTKNERRQNANADGTRNQDCFNCGKPGHYARDCRSGGGRSSGGYRSGDRARVDRYERSRGGDRYDGRRDDRDRYSRRRSRSRSRSVSRSPRRRDVSRSPVRRSYGATTSSSRRSPSRSPRRI